MLRTDRPGRAFFAGRCRTGASGDGAGRGRSTPPRFDRPPCRSAGGASTGDFTPPQAILTLMGTWSVLAANESIVVGNTTWVNGGQIITGLQCSVFAIAANFEHAVLFKHWQTKELSIPSISSNKQQLLEGCSTSTCQHFRHSLPVDFQSLCLRNPTVWHSHISQAAIRLIGG